MNQLTPRDLASHVTILGWLYIIGHVVFLLIGGFIFLLLTTVGVVSGESEATAVLGIVGSSVGLFLAAFALPGMIAGYGLLQHREWGRILALVMGFLNLVNFPVGTAIGVYTFWVLLQPVATDYFSSGKPMPT